MQVSADMSHFSNGTPFAAPNSRVEDPLNILRPPFSTTRTIEVEMGNRDFGQQETLCKQ
jgi:hypothetical protein